MAKKTKEKTKPQKPPKEPKQKKTKDARYSKRRKGLFFALLATLLIAVSVVGACTVFFQVETVTVTGNERYSEPADPGRCLRENGGQHDPHALGADRPAHL